MHNGTLQRCTSRCARPACQLPGTACRSACLLRQPKAAAAAALQTLIRLEDTIIFSLIERAQFARNDPVYEPDAIPVGAGRLLESGSGCPGWALHAAAAPDLHLTMLWC